MLLSSKVDNPSSGPGFIKQVVNRMIKGTEKNVTLKKEKENGNRSN